MDLKRQCLFALLILNLQMYLFSRLTLHSLLKWKQLLNGKDYDTNTNTLPSKATFLFVVFF